MAFALRASQAFDLTGVECAKGRSSEQENSDWEAMAAILDLETTVGIWNQKLKATFPMWNGRPDNFSQRK